MKNGACPVLSLKYLHIIMSFVHAFDSTQPCGIGWEESKVTKPAWLTIIATWLLHLHIFKMKLVCCHLPCV